MLQKAKLRPHFSFHTPGHKIGKWDLTELSFSDNLSAPKGCILQAEKDISTLLGSEKSFILTDGSTSGVLSMLYAAKLFGVKHLAFFEDSHKSVYNGCSLLGISPLLLFKDENSEAIAPLLEKADAVFLTSPDYYGCIPDLQKIRRYCDEKGKLLLIDGAHGGHLRFKKPLYAGSYADLWVDGVHKSLPAFTQGAVVSARTQTLAENLRKAVDIFRTTSPSYPIMASVEYAVKYPANAALEEEVALFRAENQDRILPSEDWTKLCVLFEEKAFEADKILQSQGTYAEFCDGNVVMFYLSPATRMADFIRLKKQLRTLFKRYPFIQKDGGRVALKEKGSKNTPTVYEIKNGSAVYASTEWVDVKNAENRICAANCGLFPPCTPLIRAGERIQKEKIALLEQADNLFGIIENKILVYKE